MSKRCAMAKKPTKLGLSGFWSTAANRQLVPLAANFSTV
jgi:hypothetical protein